MTIAETYLGKLPPLCFTQKGHAFLVALFKHAGAGRCGLWESKRAAGMHKGLGRLLRSPSSRSRSRACCHTPGRELASASCSPCLSAGSQQGALYLQPLLLSGGREASSSVNKLLALPDHLDTVLILPRLGLSTANQQHCCKATVMDI